MRETSRLIKYLAIAFALFLAFSIVSGIMYGITFIGNMITDNPDSVNVNEKFEEITFDENITGLDINIKSVNLIIKDGEQLKAETNNKEMNYKIDNGKLYIVEDKHNWFSKNNDSDLIIYLPSGTSFNNIKIESGAGKFKVDSLNTETLELDLGAGKVNINNLNVVSKVEIDGGAGEIIIKDGNINNLDLDMGVGRVELNTLLTGSNEIDAGIGELVLNLVGTNDNYKLHLNKGIGEILVDGNSMKDDSVYGNGVNTVNVDGGIGKIDINFIN